MEALLVLASLCCAVRAGLPVVDTAAPPEARSAAALLTPFMLPQNATLVVLGRVGWTGAFLEELSADVPRVLTPSVMEIKRVDVRESHPRLAHALVSTRCAFLLPVDGLDDLLLALSSFDPFAFPTRVLFWATVAAPRDAVLRRLARARASMWLSRYDYAVALTAPNGSTTLYRLAYANLAAAHRDGTKIVTETNSWLPATGRWRRGSIVFGEFCDWRPGKSQELIAFVVVISKRGLTPSSPLSELSKIVKQVAAGHRGRTTVRYEQTAEYGRVHDALKACTLAAVLADRPLYSESTSVELTLVPGMEMAHVAVIVPAGLGARISPLDAVTVEFSAMLWCATGMAALCTVLFLRCTRRQDVSGAVLQALAPMLGQPPPPPAPPKPMLAAWLLACVVLTAAYQGLLLGKLSSAVPRHELESLQDLEDSGLPLKVLKNLAHSRVLTNNQTCQAEYVVYAEVDETIDTIASARNCALVTYLDEDAVNSLRPFILPPNKKLHVIQLPYSEHNVIGMVTKGSPLGHALVRTLGLLEAGGLPARWRAEEYGRVRQERARRLVMLQEPRVLTLWHLHPAFVVLGVGHAAAVAAFALEALCAWRRARRPSRAAVRRVQSHDETS
ncbi:Ionotropic receptor 167 [Frankliniella occidentalis]|nr:Ionotropic receptor 167 [Frankliniella occidentalis]